LKTAAFRLASAACAVLTLGACAERAATPSFFEDRYARYYTVEPGRILRVEADGTILDITCVGVDAAARRSREDLPARLCAHGTIPVVGRARAAGGGWDIPEAAPGPEPSGGADCRPLFGAVGLDSRTSPENESCWNRFWEIPAAVVLAPVVVVGVLGIATAPIWAPLVFLR